MVAAGLEPHVDGYRDLLARSLAGRDEAVLLSDATRRLAAADIAARIERLGDELRVAGAGPETLVALRFEPGVDAILAILSVLSTGAAYLPLDPRHGESRAGQILTATTPDFLLDRRGLKPLVDAPTHRPTRGLDDLAYVISTSGSTGTPKAAMLEQRGLVLHTEAMIDLLDLTADDVVLQTAPPSFDIAVWQCTTPIVAGARTHVTDEDERLDPRALWRVIVDEGVTVTQLVPSMIRVMLDSAPPQSDLALRHVISTGEALEPALANRWFEYYPDLPLVNLYGPAECSDDVSVHVLRGPVDANRPVPIGVPFAGADLRLLDADGTPVSDGETGRLQVCGAIVGRGYRNDPERTATAFGTVTLDGELVRSYDTGDLAYVDEHGLLRYVGREDFQVKIRGNRVELGEIEHVVAAVDTVRSCVVTTFDDDTDRLVAHVEIESTEEHFDRGVLRRHVAERLPGYMVPSAFVPYEQLPLNVNGKVDRARLSKPTSTDRVTGSTSRRRAETFTERALARSWGRLLDLDDVPIDADFFDLGGTSLLAVISIDELSRELGYEIPTRTLITGGTIERIAAALDGPPSSIEGAAEDPHATGVVQIQEHPDGTPLFLYPGEAVSALGMVELGRLVAPDRPVYVFEPARPVDGEPGPSMRVLAERCRAAIAHTHPDGPIHLAGFCMGGDVAWEIAHQRALAGEATASVQLLQTERDGVYPQWPSHMGRLRVALARIRQRVHFEIATARALGRAQRRSHIRHLVIGKMVSKFTLPLEKALHRSGLGSRLGLRPSLRLRQHLWALVDRAAYDGWTPRSLECPVTVVRATEQHPMVEPDPLLGWGSTGSPNLSAREVTAFHWTFLHQPAVNELARVVSAELARNDGASGSRPATDEASS